MGAVKLELKFSQEQIGAAVRRLGREMSKCYGDSRPLLVGVLKGSFVFMADLVREMTIPFEVDFMRARSYGAATVSSGNVQILKDVETSLRDRHVVVIEDIADTGLTLSTVVARIHAGGPASVKRCALLVREGCEPPDFSGFTVGAGFVVGYGIDYAEQHRGLREIYTLVQDESEQP
jgi:hypoxanthine phosphoribosyltransferase